MISKEELLRSAGEKAPMRILDSQEFSQVFGGAGTPTTGTAAQKPQPTAASSTQSLQTSKASHTSMNQAGQDTAQNYTDYTAPYSDSSEPNYNDTPTYTDSSDYNDGPSYTDSPTYNDSPQYDDAPDYSDFYGGGQS